MADPRSNIITDEQYNMLHNIFRITIQEIRSDEDKTKLAPGELGINYQEGAFYIRDPHTGNLFSPNSLEHIKLILSKFTPGTNRLNADSVNNVRFYTRLSQLDYLGIDFTPDSVIRQMTSPSIFFGPVIYEDNYKTLGWPGPSGMCEIHKGSEEDVIIRFYDSSTYTMYNGKYNRYNHLFVGWVNADGIDVNYVNTVGGGNHAVINPDHKLEDLESLTVRVTETLNPGATISIGDTGDHLPIVTTDGIPISTTIEENNVIMLIYDDEDNRWVLLDSSESAADYRVKNLKNRVESLKVSFTEQLETVTENFNKKIVELTNEFDQKLRDTKNELIERPGKIDAYVSIYQSVTDGIDSIAPIENFNSTKDKLVVNYGQTLLRPELDYGIITNGIVFRNDIVLKTGDIVQFIVLKQK